MCERDATVAAFHEKKKTFVGSENEKGKEEIGVVGFFFFFF